MMTSAFAIASSTVMASAWLPSSRATTFASSGVFAATMILSPPVTRFFASREPMFPRPMIAVFMTVDLLSERKMHSATRCTQIDLVNDRAILDEVVDCGYAVQPAETALLVAAFFRLVVDDRPVVDPDGARLQLTGDAQRTVHIRGPDRRSEPVLGFVREGDRLVFAVEGLHNQDRAEHLLLRDRHRMMVDLEKCRTVEGAPRERPVLERTASYDDRGASRDRGLDHAVHAADI